MIQITHLGRRTGWYKGDWLPVIAPCYVREPAHRAFPKVGGLGYRPRDLRLCRRRGAREGGRARWARDRVYGHLVDQFWSPATNQRDDEYGGDLANRTRFAFAVLRAIRDRVGPQFIVGVRMVCDELGARPQQARGMAIAQSLVA